MIGTHLGEAHARDPHHAPVLRRIGHAIEAGRYALFVVRVGIRRDVEASEAGLERHGLQPVMTLTANDAARATVKPEEKPSPGTASATAPAKAEPPAMPAAQRLAAEKKVDTAAVTGTGRGGRVTKSDVLEHIDQARPQPDTQEPDESDEDRRRQPQGPQRVPRQDDHGQRAAVDHAGDDTLTLTLGRVAQVRIAKTF